MEASGNALGLDGVLAKLRRAEEHLAVLDREVTRYVQGRPYVPVIQPYLGQSSAPEHEIAFFVVAKHVRPLPEVIHLVAGDAVHNIRSALDYLAWQLILKDGQTPGTRTEFPIWWEAPKDRDGDGVPILMTPHPAGDIARLLDSKWLQPYHAGEPKGHPLFVLNDLDRIDKHRHLNIISSATGAGRTVLHLPDGSSIERPYRSIRGGSQAPFPLGFEDNALLGVFGRTEVGDAQYGEVHVDCEVAVHISLGEVRPMEDPGLPITVQIRLLHDFVRDKVVSLFSSLLSG